MKVKRRIEINTEVFQLGDKISFRLNDGTKLKATAVQLTPEGMLFMARGTYGYRESMDEYIKDSYSYCDSELRKLLNSEVLYDFPYEIRRRMTGMRLNNGEFDMIRIPTLEEITDDWSDEEFTREGGNLFYGMNERKNRIDFKNGEYYWVQNRLIESPNNFAAIDTYGDPVYDECTRPFGFRIVFKFKRTH